MENNVTMSTGLVTVGVRLGTIEQDVKEVNTIVQCKPINLSNYLKKKRSSIIQNKRLNNLILKVILKIEIRKII